MLLSCSPILEIPSSIDTNLYIIVQAGNTVPYAKKGQRILPKKNWSDFLRSSPGFVDEWVS